MRSRKRWLLAALLAVSPLVAMAVDEEAPTPEPVVAVTADETLESFSSHMTRGRKRRLKMAATREDTKIYEIVGRLVEDYLNKNHPDIK